jgi:hypothetical protein
MSRQTQSKDRQYLLQNSNINQDNFVYFWGKDAEGYTSDLSKSHLFNYEEVMAQHAKRTSDIPHHVDAMQSIGANAVDRDALLRLQRDMLGKAIRDAALAAGICSQDQSLTEPQLLMLADDLGAAAADTVKRNEYSLKHIQAESLMTRLARTNAAIPHGNASEEYSKILATQLGPGMS